MPGLLPGLFVSAIYGSVLCSVGQVCVQVGELGRQLSRVCRRGRQGWWVLALTCVTAWLPNVLFLLCPQYLFLTLPRIVFMLGFVVMLSFLLGGYLCFTLYLAATNQTTNEWYRGDRAWCHHCPHVARPPSAEPQVYRNIHSHGLWSNLGEIFLPAAAHCAEKMN